MIEQNNMQNIRKGIVDHLRHKEAQNSPFATNNLEWEQETNIMGQLTFGWNEMNHPIITVLSTGTGGKGRAKVIRYYDELLGEWVYKTEREIADKKVFQYSRLFKKEGTGYCVFRTFAYNHCKKKIIEQLKSDDVQSREAFEPIEWVQETNARGVITFGWLENNKQINVGISTGHISRGMVKIKRSYDEKLQEWIYITERNIDGAELVRFSRLIRSENKRYWVFKKFNPYKIRVVEQLRSENAQDKDAFEPLEWEQETNIGGQLTFSWADKNGQINVGISTGDLSRDMVNIRRYYNENLKEWIYETERQVGNRKIVRQSRLFQVENKGVKYWNLRSFNINKERVVKQLRSKNPHDKNIYEPFEWEQDTDSYGIVWFRWRENGYGKRVFLSTGLSSYGVVKIRRYYDNALKEWLYETERHENNKIIIRKSQMIPIEEDGLKYCKFKRYRYREVRNKV